MNPSLKFIYLDVGDTLVVTSYAKLISKALGLQEAIFRKAFDDETHLALYKGRLSPLDFVNSLKSQLSMFPKDAFNKWNKALGNLPIIAPMHKLVKDLEGKYKIGLLTNIFLGHFEIFYNFGKIPHLPYDAVIKSCDIGFAKPEKEIYIEAEKESGFLGKEIFFIDNKKSHVDAAINYGWRGFVFDSKNPVKSVKALRSILL